VVTRYERIGHFTLALFAVNAALQLFDGVATYVGCRGGMAEGNPLVAFAMECFGLGPGLTLAKCAAVALLGYLWLVRTNRFVPAALTVIATVYIAFSAVPWSVVLFASPPA
jgi:uncharacterized membrane protein (UPF0136 family)